MCTQSLDRTPRDSINVPAARARAAHESTKYPVAPGHDIYPADPDDPSDLSGQLLGIHYRLVRPLGRRVTLYQARRASFGDPLLVRVYLGLAVGDDMRRFLRDAQAACHLHHGHIVRVLDFGIDMLPDGRSAAYVVMEPLRGENLTSTLAKHGPLHWTRVLTIAKQLCRALIVAHDRGTVHGDLRLTNCLRISRPGAPDFIKLIDFGISAGWATPGVPGDDLHALGVLLYRLLTGRLPGSMPSLRHDVPALGISPAFAALVIAMLAANPAARPASGRALYRALVDAESEALLAPPTPEARSTPDPLLLAPRSPPPAERLSPFLAPRRAQLAASLAVASVHDLRPQRWPAAAEPRVHAASPALPGAAWTMPWADWTFWVALAVVTTMAIHAALRTV